MNRFYTGKASTVDVNLRLDNAYIGNVINIEDNYAGNRIKVRIKGIDDHLNDDDLPFCFPLIAKFVNNVPLVGETVIIFTLKANEKYENRFYVGPIIPQYQDLENSPHFFTSQSLLNSGKMVSPKESIDKIPEANGVMPDKTDVSIVGRKNTDIIQKDGEIQLRVGKHKKNNKLKFNNKNLGYISLKFVDNNDKLNKNNSGLPTSVTTIAADKILLLSHQSEQKFDITNPKELIVNEKIDEILEKAHNVPYGDVLIEFLNIFKEYASTHVHNYHGLPPCNTENLKKLMQYDLQKTISKNIKIS